MGQPETLFIDHEMKIHQPFFVVNWFMENQFNITSKSVQMVADPNLGKYLDFNTITCFADRIIDHYQRKKQKTIVFEFTGGEVTPVKCFHSILAYVKERNCKTAISSYFSRRFNYWEKLLPVLDFVTLNYHDYSNPEPFYKTVDFLHERLSLRVILMMYRKHFDECIVLGKRIMESFPDVLVSFQLPDKLINSDYTDTQLEILRKLQLNSGECTHGFNLTQKWYRGFMRSYSRQGRGDKRLPEQYVVNNDNTWKGWMCWAGIEGILITEAGMVFRACCYQDLLGNLLEGIEFPTVPVSCFQNNCLDPRDVAIKKQRQLYFNPEYIKELAKTGAF